ncbi:MULTISPECIES: nuclear transport factor 2 family protein [Marinobacter]|uniref:SnoaL-like domain-containing protein n=1 Tax=Marinobacter segnicrescens TaxID=430453 RepID=A0A1I0D5C7_9GAMM|nr:MULTISPECIES: nuclear transport factor 2 family protein [Marinobacter]UZD63999.1 nuclear transport factor 2 family protein [Marinobacter sp. AN1]SET26814.1 SnoaL-like domain-containing protein [Marinobacter segnicrescens]
MTIQGTTATATDIHQNETASATVERFQRLFNTLSSGNVTGLAEVYSTDIRFTDPFGTVTGREELQAYFEKVYTNVRSCRFSFAEVIISRDHACLAWVMHLEHPKLRRGREITVHGMTHLTIEAGRVNYHRDYFDGAELLYGNLPLLGGAIRWIRNYAS